MGIDRSLCSGIGIEGARIRGSEDLYNSTETTTKSPDDHGAHAVSASDG